MVVLQATFGFQKISGNIREKNVERKNIRKEENVKEKKKYISSKKNYSHIPQIYLIYINSLYED